MFDDEYQSALGLQMAHTWPAADVASRPMADYSGKDALRALTRVTVLGNVFVRVLGGSGQATEFEFRAPFVADLLGRYEIHARPIDASGATARLQAVCVMAAGPQVLRTLVNAAGGAVALDARAATFVAFAASTLTIAGIAAAATAGQRIPLFPTSTLNTGAGALEFAL